MIRRPPPQITPKPWIEWCANRIEDPAARLKFLQSVTPLAVPNSRRFWRWGLAAIVLLVLLGSFLITRAATQVKTPPPAPAPKAVLHPLPATAPAVDPVWLVDQSGDSEIYSNGLRIDTRFESPNHPRAYLTFPVDHPENAGVRHTAPAGIVFHTTESRQLPFEASANGALKRVGESLIDYVRRRHAYHFLIDRFGRVYRIVPESDAANHAGYSVWADDAWLYVNLNESFLGISFEASTEPGQEDPSVSPGQIRSAAMLTEMLRARYAIPAENCVTHAQVSVNPENMRVGYHTDWASSFPFAQLGLPDNYARPLPAITAFGFEYDATFVHWAGTRLYAGVEASEQELAREAEGIGVVELRKRLRKRYRARLAEMMALNGGSDAAEGATR
jgi:N-acetylmuramoyl-L-alanine amidase